MASTKRELPSSDQLEFKKARLSGSEPSQSAAISRTRVVLNPADCDIDFNVERDGLLGSALYEEGFAYCWSGARANTGITRGKYCFGCKIVSSQPVEMEDTPIDLQHVCRIGISRGDAAVRNLGETSNSFGFGGTGKFSNSGNFLDYGEKFGIGDTIVCAVDLESWPMASLGFSKNGKWLGVAKHFDAGPIGLGVVGSPERKLPWESAIFPHVLLKNVVVQLQFSTEDGLVLIEGYRTWADAIGDGNTVLGPAFLSTDECEVIMMVGLPASGKTTWAEKWVNKHPEKRYVLLGTNLALEQMKVFGLLRKHNYGERFDRLMDRATKIFNVLLSRASKIPRNFIIDQTNVYKSARRRKLKPFADFIKIAVVVFPMVENLTYRAEKRFQEMGKEVPAEAINEMLANYTLPMSKDMPFTDEYFDQVWFVELGRADAQRCLDVMKSEISAKPCVPLFSRENSVMSSGGSLSQNHQKAPMQPYTGPGDHYANSYACQPPSGAPNGSFNPGPAATYNPGCDFEYSASFGGYACVDPKLTHSVGIDPKLTHSVGPYPRPSSLPYNTSYLQCANLSRGTAIPPTSYGSYRPQIARPPPPSVHPPQAGFVPNHVHNVGVSLQHPTLWTPPPMAAHPHGNFPNHMQNSGVPTPLPVDIQQPAVHPRPPQGY